VELEVELKAWVVAIKLAVAAAEGVSTKV